MSDVQQKLLNHFLHPKNVGVIEQPDGYARVENPINGYTTDIYLRIREGRIQDITFKTFGCTVSIASGSALTELVKGKSLAEIVTRHDAFDSLCKDLRGALGDIPAQNWHCVPTAIQSFFFALRDYYTRMGKTAAGRHVDEILADIHKYVNMTLAQREG